MSPHLRTQQSAGPASLSSDWGFGRRPGLPGFRAAAPSLARARGASQSCSSGVPVAPPTRRRAGVSVPFGTSRVLPTCCRRCVDCRIGSSSAGPALGAPMWPHLRIQQNAGPPGRRLCLTQVSGASPVFPRPRAFAPRRHHQQAARCQRVLQLRGANCTSNSAPGRRLGPLIGGGHSAPPARFAAVALARPLSETPRPVAPHRRCCPQIGFAGCCLDRHTGGAAQAPPPQLGPARRRPPGYGPPWGRPGFLPDRRLWRCQMRFASPGSKRTPGGPALLRPNQRCLHHFPCRGGLSRGGLSRAGARLHLISEPSVPRSAQSPTAQQP